MAVLTLANGGSTFGKAMGFASAQPILRAQGMGVNLMTTPVR
jgi:hypothetical protein